MTDCIDSNFLLCNIHTEHSRLKSVIEVTGNLRHGVQIKVKAEMNLQMVLWMRGHTCVLHWPLGDATANILYSVMGFIYSVMEISCFTALIHGLWHSKYMKAKWWRRSVWFHFSGRRGAMQTGWSRNSDLFTGLDSVFKGYSQRVLRNLFLAPRRDSTCWKQLPCSHWFDVQTFLTFAFQVRRKKGKQQFFPSFKALLISRGENHLNEKTRWAH